MKFNELTNAFGPIPDDCYKAMMAAARGVKEERTVRKKITFVLVMMLVLILAAGVAIALTSWKNTASDVAANEKDSGYFESWPTDKKAALAAAVIAQGYTEKTAEAKKLQAGGLSNEETQKIANDILSDFTGREVSEISFMEIMQAAWGPFEQWSKEDQAWYSQLMLDMGIQGQNNTMYVLPAGLVNEQKAITIACLEVAKGYGVDEKALEEYAVTTSFQVPEFEQNKQKWWYVELQATDAIPPKDRLFTNLWVFIHPETGALYESVESILASKRAYEAESEYLMNDPMTISMRDFSETHGARNQGVSLEAKALWSRTLSKEIVTRYAKEPDFFNIVDVAFSSFTYGLPDGKAIPMERALELAQKALVKPLGRNEAEIPFFSRKPDVYYDVTNPDKPLWKFFFHMPLLFDNAQAKDYYGEGVRLPNYKVELDARTGELIRAFPVDLRDVHTMEDWKRTM